MPEHLIDIGLPFEAAPGDPKRLLEYQAAKAASQLFHACHRCGLNLWAVSGYRSYQRQKELFTGSPFVAEPGTSEHQSGLALDVSCPSIHMELSERFSATGEGRWLKKNAPLYGFILRYPKSKEEITGIPYEPWHIRYVTKPLASWLTITNLTLEEYHCFPSRCPHPPDLQLLASTSDVYILICTHFSVHLMHFYCSICLPRKPAAVRTRARSVSPSAVFSLLVRRITAPMASLAHRIGCIIFWQNESIASEMTDIFSLLS